MNKRKKSHTIKGVRIIHNDKIRDDNTVTKYRLSDEDKQFIDKIYSRSLAQSLARSFAKNVVGMKSVGEGFKEI